MIIKPAGRLSHISEYYFSSKLKELRAMQQAGKPIINLGIGSPDLPPHPAVIEALDQAIHQEDSHGYPPYQGIPELSQAVRSFYKRHYHVSVEDDKQVLPLLGSKEGITHVSLAYLNTGDQVLVPSPGYPTYTSVTYMAGGEPVPYPLDPAQRWEPDWEYLEALNTSRVKLMWTNYPHMPTGAPGSRELLERLVDFAKRKNILLCHDNPYSFVLTGKPLSIFNVEGAGVVAIELNSLSKSFNMAGWRVGWSLGSRELIQPVLQIKSNIDSGMFRPIQEAAVRALELDSGWFSDLNHTYRDRQVLVFDILEKLKCSFIRDQAGLFVWAGVPEGSGEVFSDRLLEEKNVFVTPGFIFGGKLAQNYIRVSLCAPVETLKEVYNRL